MSGVADSFIATIKQTGCVLLYLLDVLIALHIHVALVGQLLDFGNEFAEIFLVIFVTSGLAERLVLLVLVPPPIVEAIEVDASELRRQVTVARSGRGPHSQLL